MRITHLTAVLAAVTVLAGACAAQRPVIYPSDVAARGGSATADLAVDRCVAGAKDQGVYAETSSDATGEAAVGAATGGAAGAAAGAVYGNAGKGAAAGAAGGAAGGFVRGMLRGKKRSPDPITRRYVEQCLNDQGYKVMGWR